MPLIITLTACAAAVILTGLITGTPMIGLVADLTATAWSPDSNTMTLETASGLNPLYVYYLTFILAAGAVYLWTRQRNAAPFTKDNLFANIRLQAVLVCLILVAAQTAGHLRWFRADLADYFGKTEAEKMERGFKPAYNFAQYCRGQLSGSHRCAVRTDIDLSPDKYWLTYVAVRYYVYPLDITAREETGTEDCIIAFLKDNPTANIPPDFVTAPPYDAKSLIAFRKGLKQ